MSYRFRSATAQLGSDATPLTMRMANTFAMAHVTMIDDSGKQRKLQVKTRTGEIEDDISEYRPAGLKHKKRGETVLIRFAGHRRNAMALCTDSGMVGGDYLQDEDVAVDDDRGLHIWLAADGIHIACNGLPLVVENCSKFRVEGPIEATGEITAVADGAGIPLSTHIHGGVSDGTDDTEGPEAP